MSGEGYLLRALREQQDGQSDEDAFAAALAASLAEAGLGPEDGEDIPVRPDSDREDDEDDEREASRILRAAARRRERGRSSSTSSPASEASSSSSSTSSSSSSSGGRRRTRSHRRKRKQKGKKAAPEKTETRCDAETLAYLEDWADKVESVNIAGIKKVKEAILNAAPSIDYGPDYDSDVDETVSDEMGAISAVLTDLGYDEFVEGFERENYVTFERARNLTHSDLRAVGVPLFHMRDRIMEALRNITEETSTPQVEQQDDFEPEDMSDDEEGGEGALDDDLYVIRQILRGIGMEDMMPTFEAQNWTTLDHCSTLTHLPLRDAGVQTFAGRHAIISAFEDTRARENVRARLERQRRERRQERRRVRLLEQRKARIAELEATHGPPQVQGLRLKKSLTLSGSSSNDFLAALPPRIRSSAMVTLSHCALPNVNPADVAWSLKRLTLNNVVGIADWLENAAVTEHLSIEEASDLAELPVGLTSTPGRINLRNCRALTRLADCVEASGINIRRCEKLEVLASSELECGNTVQVADCAALRLLAGGNVTAKSLNIEDCHTLAHVSGGAAVHVTHQLKVSDCRSFASVTEGELRLEPRGDGELAVHLLNVKNLETLAGNVAASAEDRVRLDLQGAPLVRGLVASGVARIGTLELRSCNPERWSAYDDLDWDGYTSSSNSSYSAHDSDTASESGSDQNDGKDAPGPVDGPTAVRAVLANTGNADLLWPAFHRRGFVTVKSCKLLLTHSLLKDVFNILNLEERTRILEAFAEAEIPAEDKPPTGQKVAADPLEHLERAFNTAGLGEYWPALMKDPRVLRPESWPTFTHMELRNVGVVTFGGRERCLSVLRDAALTFSAEPRALSVLRGALIEAGLESSWSHLTTIPRINNPDEWENIEHTELRLAGVSMYDDRQKILQALSSAAARYKSGGGGAADLVSPQDSSEDSDVSDFASDEDGHEPRNQGSGRAERGEAGLLADNDDDVTENDEDDDGEEDEDYSDVDKDPETGSVSSDAAKRKESRRATRKALRRVLRSKGRADWYRKLVRAGFDDIEKCRYVSHKDLKQLGQSTKRSRKPIIAALRALARGEGLKPNAPSVALIETLEDVGEPDLVAALGKDGIFTVSEAVWRLSHDRLRSFGVVRFEQRRHIIAALHEAVAVEMHEKVGKSGADDGQVLGSLQLAREAAQRARDAEDEALRAKQASLVYQVLATVQQEAVYDAMVTAKLCATVKLQALTHDDLRSCNVASFEARMDIIEAFRAADLPAGYAEEGSEPAEDEKKEKTKKKSKKKKKKKKGRAARGGEGGSSSHSHSSDSESDEAVELGEERFILANLRDASLAGFAPVLFEAGVNSVRACRDISESELTEIVGFHNEALLACLHQIPDVPRRRRRRRSNRRISRSRSNTSVSTISEAAGNPPEQTLNTSDGPHVVAHVLDALYDGMYTAAVLQSGVTTLAQAKEIVDHTYLRNLGIALFSVRVKILRAFRSASTTMGSEHPGSAAMSRDVAYASDSSVSSGFSETNDTDAASVHSESPVPPRSSMRSSGSAATSSSRRQSQPRYGSRAHVERVLKVAGAAHAAGCILDCLRGIDAPNLLRAASRLSHQVLYAHGLTSFLERSVILEALRNGAARTEREPPVLRALGAAGLPQYWEAIKEAGLDSFEQCLDEASDLSEQSALHSLGMTPSQRFFLARQLAEQQDAAAPENDDFERASQPEMEPFMQVQIRSLGWELTDQDKQILQALRLLGLATYYSLFRSRNIRTVRSAQELSTADLESYGPIIGRHRQAILDAFAALELPEGETSAGASIPDRDSPEGRREMALVRAMMAPLIEGDESFAPILERMLERDDMRTLDGCRNFSPSGLREIGCYTYWMTNRVMEAASGFDAADFVSSDSSGSDSDDEGRSARREARARRRAERDERLREREVAKYRKKRREKRRAWKQHLKRLARRTKERATLKQDQDAVREGPHLHDLHGLVVRSLELRNCDTLETLEGITVSESIDVTSCRGLVSLDGLKLNPQAFPKSKAEAEESNPVVDVDINSCNNLTHVWAETPDAVISGSLEIFHCHSLEQITSGSLTIHRNLRLHNCRELVSVAANLRVSDGRLSLVSLPRLEQVATVSAVVSEKTSVEVEDCQELQELAFDESALALSALSVENCPKLREIGPPFQINGDVFLRNLESLEVCAVGSSNANMRLVNIPKLGALDVSSAGLANLVSLSVTRCGRLFEDTQVLGGLLGELRHLKKLDLSSAEGLRALPDILPPSLTSLLLSNCRDLTSLPSEALASSRGRLTLDITDCHALTSIPSSAHLGSLVARNCKSLRIIPRGLRVGRVKEQWKNGFIVVDPKANGNVDLTGCTALQLFGMTEVLGTLTLSGSGLTELPPVRVLGDLVATSMPELLKVHAGTFVGQIKSSAQGLVTGGKVNFRRCMRLQEVDLDRVLGSLHLSHCPTLTKLGAQRLEIGVPDPGLVYYNKHGRIPSGTLHMQHCTTLQELPAELICYEGLDMHYCMALKSLGRSRVTVGFPALTKIPPNPEAGFMRVLGSSSLETLPRKIIVYGMLLLAMADDVQSLPSLEVYGAAFLYQCLKLQKIPRDVRVRGALVIYECPALETLPANWALAAPPTLTNANTNSARKLSRIGSVASKVLRPMLSRSRSSLESRIVAEYSFPAETQDASEPGDEGDADGRSRRRSSGSSSSSSSSQAEAARAEREAIENEVIPSFEDVPEMNAEMTAGKRGSLFVIDCVKFKEVPRGLRVPGSLGVMSCGEVRSLPEDLEVGGDLILNRSVMIESIPQTIFEFMAKSVVQAKAALEVWKAAEEVRVNTETRRSEAALAASKGRLEIQEIKRKARLAEKLALQQALESVAEEEGDADDEGADVEDGDAAEDGDDPAGGRHSSGPTATAARAGSTGRRSLASLGSQSRRRGSGASAASGFARRALGSVGRRLRAASATSRRDSAATTQSALSTASSQVELSPEDEVAVAAIRETVASAEAVETEAIAELERMEMPTKPTTLSHTISLGGFAEDSENVAAWRAAEYEGVSFSFSGSDDEGMRREVTSLVVTRDHHENDNDYGADSDDESDSEYDSDDSIGDLDEAVRFWSIVAGWVDREGRPLNEEAKTIVAAREAAAAIDSAGATDAPGGSGASSSGQAAGADTGEAARNSSRRSTSSSRKSGRRPSKPAPIFDINPCVPSSERREVLYFLSKLRSSVEFRRKSMRRGLAERVMEIIKLLVDDEETREEVVLRMTSSVDRCEDKPIWALNQMQVVSEISHARGDRDKLRELGRRIMRLGFVHDAAARSIASRGGFDGTDDVCVFLRYEIDLRVPLNLPVSSRGMRYETYISIPTSEIFEVCRRIRAITEEEFEAWLAGWSEWERQLRLEFAREVVWEKLPTQNRRVSLGRTDLSGDEILDPVEIDRAVFSFEELMAFWVPNGTDIFRKPRSVEDMKTRLFRCIPAVEAPQDGQM